MRVPVSEIENKYDLGLHLMNKGAYEYAREVFENALSLEPDDVREYRKKQMQGGIHFNLGYAMHHLGDEEAAERHWLASTRLFRGNFLGYSALYKLYAGHPKKRFWLGVRRMCNLVPLFRELYKYNLRCAEDEALFAEFDKAK